FLCMFASFGIATGVKGYFALFLLLETGMMGVFCALDFFLFFVFWEMMLLPMYFLITLLGSVLLLVTILYLYFAAEPNSFDMVKLGELVRDKIPLRIQILLW